MPEDARQHRTPTWPLGSLEERVMRVLWQQGPRTVREVRDLLAAEQPLAYTTVMTVMARLAAKRLLRREVVGHGYQYTPRFTENEYAALVTQRLADALINRFGDAAVAQFAAALERIDPGRLRLLARLAAEEKA